MAFTQSLILVVLVSACGPSGPALRNTGRQKIDNGAANKNPTAKDDLPITPGPCPKQPVMFLHGLMGGSKTSFAGVIKHFEGLGCKVTLPDVSAVNSTELRAAQVADKIKQFLSSTSSNKVNIVAHSQGGLDARYALSKLGMAGSVASLSMLSTPNYGSPLADLVLKDLKDLGNPLSKIFLSFAFNSLSGVSNTNGGKNNDSTSAMRALSTVYMRETFNPNTPDAPGVLYQSWAGRTGPGTKDRNKDTLWATQAYLAKQAGQNDGIVSVASARWGEFKGVLDADHLDLGGTKMGDAGAGQFDHIKFLEQLLRDLRAKGL